MITAPCGATWIEGMLLATARSAGCSNGMLTIVAIGTQHTDSGQRAWQNAGTRSAAGLPAACKGVRSLPLSVGWPRARVSLCLGRILCLSRRFCFLRIAGKLLSTSARHGSEGGRVWAKLWGPTNRVRVVLAHERAPRRHCVPQRRRPP